MAHYIYNVIGRSVDLIFGSASAAVFLQVSGSPALHRIGELPCSMML